MPFLLPIILLLPLADIFLSIKWLWNAPLAASVYFLASILAGALLIRFAKIGMGEILKVVREENFTPALFAGFGFAKLWVAGALLIFPGYLTDIIAALLIVFTLVWWARGGGDNVRRGASGAEPEMELEAEVVEQEETHIKHERD